MAVSVGDCKSKERSGTRNPQSMSPGLFGRESAARVLDREVDEATAGRFRKRNFQVSSWNSFLLTNKYSQPQRDSIGTNSELSFRINPIPTIADSRQGASPERSAALAARHAAMQFSRQSAIQNPKSNGSQDNKLLTCRAVLLYMLPYDWNRLVAAEADD